MLTVFACPKPFSEPHTATIQRNAIQSWRCIASDIEIILFGDEEGTYDICREFGLKHVPKIKVNERGTPLLSDIFAQANAIATHPLVCYINSDIILFPEDFLPAVRQIAKRFRTFLIVGQRWGLCVLDPLDFHSNIWESQLRANARAVNEPHGPHAIDYFLSPRGLLASMPPFLIGRPGWDPWFIENALRKRIPVVDVTESVMVVHQAHHHDHAGGLELYLSGPEAKHNHTLVRPESYRYTMDYATHRLTPSGIKGATLRRTKAHLRHLFWYWVVCKTGPIRQRLGLRRAARDSPMIRYRYEENLLREALASVTSKERRPDE